MTKLKNKPVVLVILDGWGIAPAAPGNAISQAKTPNMDKFISSYPALSLQASGPAVGLFNDAKPSSELGHLMIGSGQAAPSNLARINQAIKNKSFFKNSVLLKAFEQAKIGSNKLHLIGLLGSAGDHAQQEHLYALLEMAKQQEIKQVYLHLILDGLDSPFNSAQAYLKELSDKINQLEIKSEIATISGRYFAMDRDNNWQRTARTVLAMTAGLADEHFTDPFKAIKQSYEQEIYDEKFVPVVITRRTKPVAIIENGDVVIFANLRADRSRQLVQALTDPDFKKIPQLVAFKNLYFVSLTDLGSELPVSAVAFSKTEISKPLARVISEAGLKQLHIAETEKFAQVTYYFNGLKKQAYEGEDDLLINSADVDHYDKKPGMSLHKLINQFIKLVTENTYDFIVINFANPDMVAHSGNLKAAIKACEICDKELGKLVNLVLSKNGLVLVTADHGDIEEMQNIQTGEVNNEHSTNPVPFIIIGEKWEGKNIGLPESLGADLSVVKTSGNITDIAPTILKLMGQKQPPEMTGKSLI